MTPGWYYLTVRGTTPGTNQFTIRAQTFSIGSSVINLTSGVAVTNGFTAAESQLPGAIDYYLFTVSTNAVRVDFDVFDMDENVDMIVRKDLPLPTLTQFDYASTNDALIDEQVKVLTDSVPVVLSRSPELSSEHSDLLNQH